MKIIKEEVKTFIETAICDCGGEMAADGSVLCSNPPQYTMYCKKCGVRERGYIRYPRTVMENITLKKLEPTPLSEEEKAELQDEEE